MTTPQWLTSDWKKAFFTVERRLSPKLEQLVRTDAFLDTLAVANGLTRFAARTVGDLSTGVVEAVGLPSTRQVRRLQRSIDDLARRAP